MVELCFRTSGQGGGAVEVRGGMGSLWFFGNGRGVSNELSLVFGATHWDPPCLLALASGRGGSVRGHETGCQSRLQVKVAGGRRFGGWQ